ncbi:hypothetical protein MNEG_10876, partial [Monoraphidium neglectum]
MSWYRQYDTSSQSQVFEMRHRHAPAPVSTTNAATPGAMSPSLVPARTPMPPSSPRASIEEHPQVPRLASQLMRGARSPHASRSRSAGEPVFADSALARPPLVDANMPSGVAAAAAAAAAAAGATGTAACTVSPGRYGCGSSNFLSSSKSDSGAVAARRSPSPFARLPRSASSSTGGGGGARRPPTPPKARPQTPHLAPRESATTPAAGMVPRATGCVAEHQLVPGPSQQPPRAASPRRPAAAGPPTGPSPGAPPSNGALSRSGSSSSSNSSESLGDLELLPLLQRLQRQQDEIDRNNARLRAAPRGQPLPRPPSPRRAGAGAALTKDCWPSWDRWSGAPEPPSPTPRGGGGGAVDTAPPAARRPGPGSPLVPAAPLAPLAAAGGGGGTSLLVHPGLWLAGGLVVAGASAGAVVAVHAILAVVIKSAAAWTAAWTAAAGVAGGQGLAVGTWA